MTEPSETTEEVVEEVVKGYDFDDEFQNKIAGLALHDPVFAQKTDGLILPDYFENVGDKIMVQIAREFYAKYKSTPDRLTLKIIIKEAIDAGKIKRELIPELRSRLTMTKKAGGASVAYALDKVEDFAKKRALENAILASVSLLDKGRYAEVEAKIRAAANTGLHSLGEDYNYWDEIDTRTDTRIALATGALKPTGITTGIPELDALLYHNGWGRRELSALMGAAKFGKSMGLGDFAKNASLAGYNVLLLSLENSREIYADRIDANVSDTLMTILKNTPHEVAKRVKALSAKAGLLELRAFPPSSLKPSDIRRMLERLRDQGKTFDLIVVDYADIMAPEYRTDSNIENSKSIWIDLRAIMVEGNYAGLTATQTNREGAKGFMPKMTDVAEDFNKIRIADLVIAGAATQEEIDAGTARLRIEASRNQKGATLTVQQDRERMKFIKKVLSAS